MKIVTSEHILPEIQKLLSYATSESKIEQEYMKYINLADRSLYVKKINDVIVACIGVHFFRSFECEITHIAVSAEKRGEHIATEMIEFICEHHSIHLITAQTDGDAVGFYQRFGFSISSLGELYPGVERFKCIYDATG